MDFNASLPVGFPFGSVRRDSAEQIRGYAKRIAAIGTYVPDGETLKQIDQPSPINPRRKCRSAWRWSSVRKIEWASSSISGALIAGKGNRKNRSPCFAPVPVRIATKSATISMRRSSRQCADKGAGSYEG